MEKCFSFIRSICKRELNSYFYSPIAYVVISIFLGIMGWFFFNEFFLRDEASLRSFFGLLPWIFTFIIPAVTMRLYSEEESTGSYEMLVTLPIKEVDIVLGKFLGAFIFVGIMISPSIFYAIIVETIGDLDWGPVIGGFLGSLLLASTYISIGIFTSSVTKNQIIAFILSVLFCFILTSIDSFFVFLPSSFLGVFQYISASYHFQSVAKGLIDTRDFFYFLSSSFLFLLMTHQVMLEKYRK